MFLFKKFFSILVFQHLTLPFFIHRHQLLGPWTRAIFRIKSWTGASHQAGQLTLINLIFPLSTIYLSYLANLLGITLRTCHKIHHATSWMAVALLSFYIIVVGAISLGSYKVFLRAHQLLAVLFIYSTWQYIQFQTHSSKIYLFITLGIFRLKGRQDTMELFLQLYCGLTADLHHYVPAAAKDLVSFLALFTGPHGTNEDISHYKSILVVTSGFRITAVILYLKKMIYSYNTYTSHIYQLHLVWQVEAADKITAALTLINNLLEDDIIDNSYGVPDFKDIILLEASSNQIKRLSNIQDKQG
ncbi:hypothetical protein BJX70DRAFT_392130 [Aspergillus crustosus]